MTIPDTLDSANRIAALCFSYRDNKPEYLRRVRRLQLIEAERQAVEGHDFGLADDLDSQQVLDR